MNFGNKNFILVISFLSVYFCFKNVNAQNDPQGAPKIIISEGSRVKYFHLDQRNQSLRCQAESNPTSNITITWTKDGKQPEELLKINEGNNYKELRFPIYHPMFAGDYECRAMNKIGNASEKFTVNTFVGKSKRLDIWIIVTIVLSVCIIIAIPIVAIIIYRLRLRVKNLAMDNYIKCFLKGDIAETEDNPPLSMPYDHSFELKKHQFAIDFESVLSRGEFGVTYKGTLILDHHSKEVAIKTTRCNSGVQYLKQLLSEFKIMIYVGEHENIVRCFGAYTNELRNGIVYIATEFCTIGSLQTYLRSNRENVAHNFNEQFLSEYQELDVNTPTVFSRSKFCKWAAEIANGMEFLAAKYIVHCDVSARNILLDSNEVAKITDFGLSRRMYNYQYYVKEGKEPLPWRWMAIESLQTMTFSTPSDVWGYGITLWEIFSLGDPPYPGVSWNVDFVEMLENNMRNPIPELADSAIYNAMLSCWNNNPKERPSFNSLKLFFRGLANGQNQLWTDHQQPQYETLEETLYIELPY